MRHDQLPRLLAQPARPGGARGRGGRHQDAGRREVLGCRQDPQGKSENPAGISAPGGETGQGQRGQRREHRLGDRHGAERAAQRAEAGHHLPQTGEGPPIPDPQVETEREKPAPHGADEKAEDPEPPLPLAPTQPGSRRSQTEKEKAGEEPSRIPRIRVLAGRKREAGGAGAGREVPGLGREGRHDLLGSRESVLLMKGAGRAGDGRENEGSEDRQSAERRDRPDAEPLLRQRHEPGQEKKREAQERHLLPGEELRGE